MPDYLRSISSDGDAFADIVEAGPLDWIVPSCPGWNLRDLGHHVGYVQRWARLAAATGAEPGYGDIEAPPDDDALPDWLRAGTAALVETLGSVHGDAPTWHPFTVQHVMAVWPRRQAHELAVHLWDAQAATGTPTPMNPVLAADFVHEYFGVIVPRVMDRDGRQPPIGRINVELTDVGGRFSVQSTATTVAAVPAIEAEAEIAGPAEDVLLALWMRRSLPGPAPTGLAAEWLSFGGN